MQDLSLDEMEALVEAHGNNQAAANALGWKRTTFRDRLAVKRREAMEYRPATDDGNIEAGVLSEDRPDVGALVLKLCKDYERRDRAQKERHLWPFRVKSDAPIGLLVFGDPHIDSADTNWPMLLSHINLVKETPGLYATNIGDVTDNWTGRLSHLLADTPMNAKERWALAKWFIEELDWLLITAGNHDLWSGATDPLAWWSSQAGRVYEDWSQRIELRFPNGQKVRIGQYHGAVGSSIWNPAHGPGRLAQTGPEDHVVVAGHVHKTGIIGPFLGQNDGIWQWGLQVGSYKDLKSSFGKRVAPVDRNAAPAAMIIIDPRAERPEDLVHITFAIERGAHWLTTLREQYA